MLNGILCLDKSQDMTSFDCCAIMRRLLGQKKIGHGGTLDPMATGVLPILVGSATRAMDILPVQDKRYIATLRFGFVSDTLDVWGNVVPTGKVPPDKQQVEQTADQFRGDILQIPPMTSALKKDGVRLYELARKGIEVEREARPITIYGLNILAYSQQTGELTFDCACSKGTYIRSICDDWGRLLGCGAVMTALRRTMAAGYTIDGCISVETAKELAANGELTKKLSPVDTAFSVYQSLTVTAAQAVRFANGGALALERLSYKVDGMARVYSPEGVFLGLGQPINDELRVFKLFPER